jgi:hypothetical protein
MRAGFAAAVMERLQHSSRLKAVLRTLMGDIAKADDRRIASEAAQAAAAAAAAAAPAPQGPALSTSHSSMGSAFTAGSMVGQKLTLHQGPGGAAGGSGEDASRQQGVPARTQQQQQRAAVKRGGQQPPPKQRFSLNSLR